MRWHCNRTLARVGQSTMAAAAASGVIAGASGLVAQHEVDLDAEGEAVLTTHRMLNIGLIATMAAMAFVRSVRRKPSLGYLVLVVAAFSVAGVSAYLGRKLVYTFGARVERTDLRPRGVKPIDRRVPLETGSANVQAVGDAGRGAQRAVDALRQGDVLPVMKPS